MVYLLLSRSGPLGVLGLLFTPTAMIIAQAILVTPIIAALTRQVVADLWVEYEEQMRSLGAGPLRAVPALLYDARFTLVTAVLAGVRGAHPPKSARVMIVGGNIDHVTRVMTTAIALEVSKGDLALALGLGIVLIGLSLAINAATFTAKQRAEAAWTLTAPNTTSTTRRVLETATILPLRVEGLAYNANGQRLIDGITFTLDVGPRTVILGPNGAGKSLLLRLCHGLIAPSGGTVTWQGATGDADAATQQAMVFQRPVLLRRSVIANVVYGLKLKGTPRAERAEIAANVLARTGLARFKDTPARLLSGGEQQKLALARALGIAPASVVFG